MNRGPILAFAFASGLMAAPPSPPVLNATAFAELSARCVPGAPLATVRSIAEVESAFHPFALNINFPEAAGVQLGMGDGSVTLSRQPSSLEEAVRWSRWFLANGQPVSVGLMQLNIEHLAAFKISIEKAFDPCTNLKVGWAIFSDKYAQASAILGKGQLAMQAALSAYNSGSLVGGFRNGHVEAILRSQYPEAEAVESPPSENLFQWADADKARNAYTAKQNRGKILETNAPEPAAPTTPNPRTTESKVAWDLTRAGAPWIARK